MQAHDRPAEGTKAMQDLTRTAEATQVGKYVKAPSSILLEVPTRHEVLVPLYC